MEDEILAALKALRNEIHRAREAVKKRRLNDDLGGPPEARAAPSPTKMDAEAELPGASAAQEIKHE